MKKITKILSVLMAAVMLMAALCVPASAASNLKSAKMIDSGKKISYTPELGEERLYKVELSKAGNLKLNITSASFGTIVTVYDGDMAEEFKPEKIEKTAGHIYGSPEVKIYISSGAAASKCALEYKLKKGTYIIAVRTGQNGSVNGKTSVTFTYPQDKSESSDSAKITSFTVTLKKGGALQLGTILSGDGTVKWSTSKKAVATVSSKGKVTAKAKGTAVITAKTGDSSMKITIKVTE